MDSIISRKEFLKTLKNIKIDKSDSFIFKNNEVITYNDFTMVSCPIESTFEGIVPIKELYTLLSKITDDEIECDTKKGSLKIKGKSFSASILLEKDTDPFIESIPISKKWNRLPKNFVDAVSTCLHTASKDTNEAILTCLHFEGGRVESCDNYRVSQYLFDSDMDKSFLLPSIACRDIVKFSPIEYSMVDGWIQFKMKEGIVLSCRLAEGDFSDLSSIVNIGNYKPVDFPKELSKILERAEIMANKDKSYNLELSVNISNSIVEIKGEGDNGWYKESIKIENSNVPDMEFIINSEFFKYVLQYSQSIEIDIDNSKLRFVGDKFTHIIGLIK